MPEKAKSQKIPDIINVDIEEYILRNLRRGVEAEDIEKALILAGWSEKDIEPAFTDVLNKTRDLR